MNFLGHLFVIAMVVLGSWGSLMAFSNVFGFRVTPVLYLTVSLIFLDLIYAISYYEAR